MEATLKYIIDDNGNKISVLVPVKAWEQLNDKYQKLTKKLSILTGIQSGLNEVVEVKKSGKNLQTLSDFLNESNS